MAKLLVTAGPTREMIDRVRDWGNIFTGSTGLAIARALTAVGEVELLTSNPQHAAAPPDGVRVSTFTSHADLGALLSQRVPDGRYAAVFMTAAVADYQPAGVYEVIDRTPGADGRETWTVRSVQAGKVRSHYDLIAVTGKPTRKLIDRFRADWDYRGLLVKFKLEVDVSREELIAIGQRSRRHSGADYLVANTLAMVSGPEAGAFLLSDAGAEWISREHLPARLADLVRRHLPHQRQG